MAAPDNNQPDFQQIANLETSLATELSRIGNFAAVQDAQAIQASIGELKDQLRDSTAEIRSPSTSSRAPW